MRFLFTLFFILALAGLTHGQDQKQIYSVIQEGKKLYRLEMASWIGTDVFLEKFREMRDSIDGYFSYFDRERTVCLFYMKSDSPRVAAAISFDSSYNVSTAEINSRQRSFTENEKDIYNIRKKSLEVIRGDTLFKTYQNTNMNLIPLIEGNNKKVYVLTGPQVDGIVIFGNDYLLSFDKANHLASKKQLHRNIITINYNKQGEEEITTMHTHAPETGDYITATDICTLMLYEKYAGWKQHIVISKNYKSFWDCHKDSLLVLSQKVLEKINKDREKRSKK